MGTCAWAGWTQTNPATIIPTTQTKFADFDFIRLSCGGLVGILVPGFNQALGDVASSVFVSSNTQ